MLLKLIFTWFFLLFEIGLLEIFYFILFKKKKKEASFEGKPISRKKAGVLRISGIKYL